MPDHHQLRSNIRFGELSTICRRLALYYSAIRRPSTDRKPMGRMLLIGCNPRLIPIQLSA